MSYHVLGARIGFFINPAADRQSHSKRSEDGPPQVSNRHDKVGPMLEILYKPSK